MISKATIARLDKVRTRSRKTVYKHLSPKEKRYTKLHEKLQVWQQAITDYWRHVKRDSSGRATQDNNWDFYHLAETNRNKIEKQIERFLLKHNWTEHDTTEVLKHHNYMNAMHCYGGSF